MFKPSPELLLYIVFFRPPTLNFQGKFHGAYGYCLKRQYPFLQRTKATDGGEMGRKNIL